MSKPPGIAFGMDRNGPTVRVTTPSLVEDQVWDAVQAAVRAGWTPERFKHEVVSAWAETLRDEAKHAEKVLST